MARGTTLGPRWQISVLGGDYGGPEAAILTLVVTTVGPSTVDDGGRQFELWVGTTLDYGGSEVAIRSFVGDCGGPEAAISTFGW